jgi:fluoroquinolone transport system permease protein
MSALVATLRLDVTVQARSLLYAVGIAVAVIMGLLVRFLIGPSHAAVGVPTAYLLGLGGTAYIFGASLVLMEKSQRTIDALRISPLTVDQYVASKLVTLVAFATIEGVIVQVIGFWGVSFNVLVLGVGIISLGLMNTLVGLGQVASHTSVLSFLMPGAALVGSVMQWPFLGALGIGPWWIYYVIPTNGPFLLMRGAFEPLATWQWGYAVGMSLVTIALLALWTRRRLRTHLRLQQR